MSNEQKSISETLKSLSLNTERYVNLLYKLIAETPHLINRPPTHIPQESLAGRHVLNALSPYTQANNGPLIVKEVVYQEQRGNIIIEYPGSGDKTCAFVGSHLDVVHADPSQWTRDPFKLIVDGDMLYGRGTTDCLGHVALLTEIFIQLATLKPNLKVSVIGVIIADEEVGGSEAKIGVEGLMHHGELNKLQYGPVYWLDCADKQPNIGSGGVVQWTLTARGKTFHSGFPHKGINAIELAAACIQYIQDRFYQDFPTHMKEKEYGFPCSSSIKPTNIFTPSGSLNQIRGVCTVEGDIRLVPFYKIKEAKQAVDKYISELNNSEFAVLKTRGPSTFSLAEDKASVEIKWHSDGMDGLACNLDSAGFKALAAATEKYVGFVKPLADTGSLPLVADLQAAGYDVQTIGYGVEDAYHADNEFARISDFEQGFKVLLSVIADLNDV